MKRIIFAAAFVAATMFSATPAFAQTKRQIRAPALERMDSPETAAAVERRAPSTTNSTRPTPWNCCSQWA